MAARKFEFLHFAIKRQLQRQLIHFGLNPKEWQFQSLQLEAENHKGHVELSHLHDANVRLKGVVKKRAWSPALIAWEWEELAWDC